MSSAGTGAARSVERESEPAPPPRSRTRSSPSLSAIRSPVASATPGSGLGQLPIISVAFALGWDIAELDLWTRLTPASAGSDTGGCPGHADVDAELASVRTLAIAQPDAVALPRISARLARLGAEYPSAGVPSTGELGRAFGRVSGPHSAEAERCLCGLHRDLAASLNAADTRLTAAYDLGRGLAYATQSPESAVDFLTETFNHDEISEPLADLSSALPPHASRAVQLSLAAWHEWLARRAADHRGRVSHGRDRLTALRFDPSLRPLWRPGIDSQSGAGTDSGDSDYLMRQGQIWRALLAGEKDIDSMMDTSNYEKAAHQLFRRGGSLLWRLTWTNKWVVSLIVALLGGGIYAVTQSHGTAKILTFGTAVLGLFGVSVKSASSAIARLCTRIGQELWGSEVDVAAAQAITRLPRGDQTKLRFDTLTDRHRAPGPARGRTAIRLP